MNQLVIQLFVRGKSDYTTEERNFSESDTAQAIVQVVTGVPNMKEKKNLAASISSGECSQLNRLRN